MRQFGFVMTLAQTNALLAYNHQTMHNSGAEILSKSEFQMELARDMVHNTRIEAEIVNDNGGMNL